MATRGEPHLRRANTRTASVKPILGVGIQSLWCGQQFRDKIVFRAGARFCGPVREVSRDDHLRKMWHGKPGWLALLRRVRRRDVARGPIERPYAIALARSRPRRQRTPGGLSNRSAIDA